MPKPWKEYDATDKVPPVRWDEPDVQIVIDCGCCGIPILTFWAIDKDVLLRGEYVQVANLIYHPRCV